MESKQNKNNEVLPNCSFWQENIKLPNFPTLKDKKNADVVIIGGGVTGILCAYNLWKAGLEVVLLERGRMAQNDTSHTSAHLTYVTDARLSDLVQKIGPEKAGLVWNAGASAIHEIERIVRKEGIDCQFQRVPGYLMASIEKPDSKAKINLQKEESLAKRLGFDVSFEENLIPFNRPALKFVNQAEFHPLKFLHGLLEILRAAGVSIYENSPAEKIEENPLTVLTANGTLFCKHLILATNNPLTGTKGMLSSAIFQTKLALYTSYVIGAHVPKETIERACYWDSSDPYYYLRVNRSADDDYLIFGGKDCKTGQAKDESKIYERLGEILKSFIPNARVDRYWSGQIINSIDALPYIGPNDENQFIATAFCGNGLTFGTLSALMASDWIFKRENQWSELFDPARPFALRESINYLQENIDYPYYFIKDHLRIPERSSPESLPCGEGKVCFDKGKRIAAYRDKNGGLSKLSPVCSHLGCVVNWNEREKAWNCPCHGSRFSPTGEVLAGPAEKPLQKI